MSEKQLKYWIKQEVLSQPHYQVKTVDYRIKLNQNESPWDWPKELKQKITKHLLTTSWNRYPELIPMSLKAKLGGILGIDSSQIVIGKGSNEVLQALTTVMLRTNDAVCLLSPTFAVYRLLVEQRSARVVESVLDDKFRVIPNDLLAKSKKARVTILCNPNTPTGTLISLDLIQAVAESTEGIVIVDEAYVDFSGVTALPLMKQFSNLIITRTFSKAFALAGFRVGYAVMAPELAGEVRKGLSPFNVDLPSTIAMEVLLDHIDLVQKWAEKIISERDWLIDELNELEGVFAWPSYANFFLMQTPIRSKTIFDKLAVHGILVRDVSGYVRCEDMVRITVGTPEDNRALIRTMRAIL